VCALASIHAFFVHEGVRVRSNGNGAEVMKHTGSRGPREMRCRNPMIMTFAMILHGPWAANHEFRIMEPSGREK
jgi:hypothetical protein